MDRENYLKKLLQSIKVDCEKINRPELSLPLTNIIAKYHYLKANILHANSVDDLEVYVDEAADLLGERIHNLRELRFQNANNEIDEVLQEQNKISEEMDNIKLPNEDIFNDLLADIKSLNKEITSTITGVKILISDLPIRDLENSVADKYEYFLRERKRLKRSQHLYRFYLAVFWGGFIVSILSSNLVKLILESVWLVVGSGLITFLVCIAKEYLISPYIRSKRLEQQRKHLLSSLNDFIDAELNLIVRTTKEELDKILQKPTEL